MIDKGPSVYQTGCAVVRRELRAGLLDAAGGAGADGFGSVVYRAAVALYALLLEHPVDRRGRCVSCRRPESVIGRCRRRCRIYPVARYWLYQRGTALSASRLGTELGLSVARVRPPGAGSGLDRAGITVTGRAGAHPTDEAAPSGGDTGIRPPVVADPGERPTTPLSPVALYPRWAPASGRPGW